MHLEKSVLQGFNDCPARQRRGAAIQVHPESLSEQQNALNSDERLRWRHQ